LRFFKFDMAGVHIALFGGLGASFFLALSALVQWVLAQPGVGAAPEVARSLHLAAFATGGPAHVALLGLLVAGLAVPVGMTRLLPRWVMVFGLVVASLAELSTLALIARPALVLLPLARFPALVFLIVVAVMLPVARGARPAPAATPAVGTPSFVALGLLALALLPAGESSAATPAAGKLIVEVNGFRNGDGQLMLRLYDPKGEPGFPTDGAQALRQVSQRISDGRAIVELGDLPFGSYAIGCIHDENGNNKLDTRLFGIPKEGVGASNDARGHRGPPKWKDARFDFKTDGATIKIHMMY
jgi:uncharacterized protein (DUF2141 family)